MENIFENVEFLGSNTVQINEGLKDLFKDKTNYVSVTKEEFDTIMNNMDTVFNALVDAAKQIVNSSGVTAKYRTYHPPIEYRKTAKSKGKIKKIICDIEFYLDERDRIDSAKGDANASARNMYNGYSFNKYLNMYMPDAIKKLGFDFDDKKFKSTKPCDKYPGITIYKCALPDGLAGYYIKYKDPIKLED